jgi:hypothetical protein
MNNTTEPTYKECQEYSVETTYDYSMENNIGNRKVDYIWIFYFLIYILLAILLIVIYKFLNFIFIPDIPPIANSPT